MQRHPAGDEQVEGPLPVFVSDSPTRATEVQGALFAAHSAHLDLHYLDSLAQVALAHAEPPPITLPSLCVPTALPMPTRFSAFHMMPAAGPEQNVYQYQHMHHACTP